MRLFIALQIIVHIVLGSWDDNNHRSGINQQGGGVASSSRLKSIDFGFGWASVETSDNNWDWSSFEKELDDLIKTQPNISIILKPSTGNDAPHWLYKSPINVPACYFNDSPVSNGPWPYYLNENYQTYFERFMSATYEWVINSKYYPSHIFVTQAMFGTTGDDSPWHGTPNEKSCDISDDQWWEFDQKMATYMYNQYYKSTPNTVPNLLLLFNFGSSEERTNWCTKNCPGSYRKNGQASHAYQLNEEYNDWLYVGYLSRNEVQTVNHNNISIRFRGETNDDQKQEAGWYKQAPYWNTFTLTQWHLTYGVDYPGWNSMQIDNKSYDITWDFFNLFDQYKHNYDHPMAAFIGLRDGLDSNDTQRFPESKYGKADINNSERMVNIANAFKDYGAKQEDPSHCTGGPMNQRKADKMNDVGFGIWRTNYGKYIEQINASSTSQGHWRIGNMKDKQQIYGRFGRSFDNASGKNKMCFTFDKYLFGGLPLKTDVNLYWNITYFDTGTGGWSFGYDSQNNKDKMGVNVKKSNQNKWIIFNFNINDGYFDQRGTMNSDFCLYSNDTKDDTIFSFIQVVKV